MKAEINAKGDLLITAETQLEAYALKQWCKGYRPKDEDGCESFLSFDLTLKPQDREGKQ